MAKKSSKSAQRVDKAYKAAVEELNKDRVNEIKAMVKATLEEMQRLDKSRQDIERKLSGLRADLDDLKRGKIEAIRKRHEKDKEVEKLSPIKPDKVQPLLNPSDYAFNFARAVAPFSYTTTSNSIDLTNAVNGVYALSDGTNVKVG